MKPSGPNRQRRGRAGLALWMTVVVSLIAAGCASNASPARSDDTAASDADTSVTSADAPRTTARTDDTGTSVVGTSTSDTVLSAGSTPGSTNIDAAPLPADVAAALGGAGIAVVDASEPQVTDAIFTLTASQAAFMSEEAVTGSGLLGANLDAAGGGTTQGLPVSAVLAGYVRGVNTAAAEYARALLSGQDLTHPQQVVFPTIVLALFASDAATAFAADEVADGSTDVSDPPTSAGFSQGGFGQARHLRAGICSDVTKSIFDAVNKIFAKIHIPPGKVGNTGSSFLNGVLQGLTDVVVGGLNFIIDAAKTLVVDGIKFVLGQVLSIVAEVAAAAALVANIVSAIRPWKLDVTAKEPNTRKGIDAEKVYDQVTAKAIIIGPTDDWPAWFVDCAAVAGVTLPSLLPVDAAMKWKVESYVPSADLMSESTDEIAKDPTLRKDGSDVVAKIGLVTGTESKEKADKGAEQHGPVLITATARRNQIEELRKTLVTAAKNLAGRILASVPKIISDFLLKLVEEAAQGSSEQVASLLDASGKVLIDVTYHGPPEPESRPSVVSTPTTHAIPDPCTLITQPEAAAASGTAVDPGINDNLNVTGLGTASSCIFRVANSTVPIANVRLDLIDLGTDPARAFAAWKAYTGFTGGPVSGVGDENFYLDASGPVLYIRTANIMIGINVLSGDFLAQATTLATLVLSRIN